MDKEQLKEVVIEELKKVYDPEMPINIYDLGLIYDIDFEDGEYSSIGKIRMTLTSVVCPMSEQIVNSVKNIGFLVEGLERIDVDLVFDPPWNKDLLPEETKLELGML